MSLLERAQLLEKEGLYRDRQNLINDTFEQLEGIHQYENKVRLLQSHIKRA